MEEKIEVKNELVLNGVNELQAGVFGGDRIKKATSLNLEKEEEMNMLLNAMQDCENKLNDFAEKELEIVGFYATERDVEGFNETTGEAVVYKKHTLMLFDVDGKSYVTGSNSCFLSFKDIITLKGAPTSEHHLFLKPIKVDAKEKGHSYLKLKLVIKK